MTGESVVDDQPDTEGPDAGGPTVSPGAPAKPRRTGLIVTLAAVVLVAVAVVVVVVLPDGGNHDQSLEQVEDAAWSGCFVYGTGDHIHETWQQEHDATITTADALATECGMFIDKIDGGWTVQVYPESHNGGIAGAIRMFGSETGCLDDVDLARLESTRALDGQVRSSDGKTSWTYHPDDGLNIVCDS